MYRNVNARSATEIDDGSALSRPPFFSPSLSDAVSRRHSFIIIVVVVDVASSSS